MMLFKIFYFIPEDERNVMPQNLQPCPFHRIEGNMETTLGWSCQHANI